MIGIVLWSDPSDRKAVFWCEDQGDLAYFEEKGADFGVTDFFSAGDMVQFDVSANHNMRKAHHPRLLHEQVCTELPDALRQTSQGAGPSVDTAHSATIIPFTRKEVENQPADLPARKA